MLLTVDIGNTQTTLGLFEDNDLKAHWAVTTRAGDTADEVQQSVVAQLSLLGLSSAHVDDMCIASVVPALNGTWRTVAQRITGLEPVVVGPGVKTGLPMRYDNPAEVGADRVADAVAAIELKGAPVVVVDLGTATNIEVIDGKGCFRGGIIAPGLMTSASALFSHAARIPQISLAVPDHVIGTNTKDAIRAGLMLGEIDRIDGLVNRIFKELGCAAPVVATGGLAGTIYGLSTTITCHEPWLTLQGLRLIYSRNR